MDGIEIDLIIDHGNQINAYEIKFTSQPNIEMTRSLVKIKKELNVKKSALLNLRKESYPFPNGITAEHWSYPV